MTTTELSEILHRVLDVAEQNVELREVIAENELDRLNDRLDASEKKVAYLTEDRNYWKGMFDLTLGVASQTKAARDAAIARAESSEKLASELERQIEKLTAKPKKVAKPAKKAVVK